MRKTTKPYPLQSVVVGWNLQYLGFNLKLIAITAVLPLLCFLGSALAQDRAHSGIQSEFAEFVEPDFPFFTQVVDARKFGSELPGNNIVPRGIILNLGGGLHGCFDPDLLRLALVWKENEQGEYLTMVGMASGSYRAPSKKAPPGQAHLPQPIGSPVSALGILPGWFSGEAIFSDPREPAADAREVGLGPIPEAMGRWQGIFLSEAGAVLKYQVAGTRVLEFVRGFPIGKEAGVLRALRIGPHEEEMILLLDEGSKVDASCETGSVVEIEGRLAVRFAAQTREMDHTVVMVPRGLGDKAALAGELAKPGWAGVEKPAAARWPEVLTTTGRRSEGGGAYLIDEIALPVPNPWRRNVRLSGLGFFPDGRAALITFDGDVWIVAGMDDALGEVRWKRFASGLHEPMGLQVVDDEIYVFDRNGIIHLVDVNGDGEADFYENFSNVVAQTAETREYAMDLLAKPGGGFYVVKGGQNQGTIGKHNGSIVEVSADGRSFEVIAHGMRQPYGGIDPETGRITASDQQGNWVPATPIRLIEKGSYHGFIPTAVKNPVQREKITEPPVWIPHIVNQSGASQVTLRGAKMGPLNDSLLHIGYNRPELFKVYLDEGGGLPQGAVASAVTGFPCALLKGAVNPVDGQLFTCGFRIFGTALDQVSGFFRVRYTGGQSHVPRDLRSSSEGVLLAFDFKVDKEIALNPATYKVERWNYRRTKGYGSGHYKMDGKPGQETMPVASVYLSKDGRAVFLGIPDMKPVHTMRVIYRLPVDSELPVVQSAYLTIHEPRRLDLAAAGFGDIDVNLEVDEGASAAATAAPEPSVEIGKTVAQTIGCIACHTTDGKAAVATDSSQVVGPTWKGLWGSERKLSDGTVIKKVDEDYLRESILDPGSRIAEGFEGLGVGMPSYLGVLQDWQIDSVILYIEKLKD